LDTNLAHARASAWAAQVVQAYEREIENKAEGLHHRVAEAITVAMMVGSEVSHWAPRINWAIDAWERASSRATGPRVHTLDDASGEVEMI